MENLFEALCATGLTDCQAKASLRIVYQWLQATYPVTATLAKATVFKEVDLEAGGSEALSGFPS